MPWWMRKEGYCDEAGDGTDGAAAGGGVGEGGVQPAADGGANVAGGQPEQPVEVGMLDAITKALAPGGDGVGAMGEADGRPGAGERPRDPVTGKFIEKPDEQQPAKQGQQQAQTPQAPQQKLGPDGKPFPDQQGQQKPAPKKADDFALKPEEKASLSQGAQRRVHEIHRAWKESEIQWEGKLGELSQQNEALAQARDSIMGVLEQTQTSPDELSRLLDFNYLAKTNPEGALRVLDEQRAILARTIGKELPGVDLLQDHPDLAARVESMQLSREDAVELANARRTRAQIEEQGRSQSQQQQGAQAARQAQETALSEITRWTNGLRGADIDYPAKEAKLIAKLDGIIKTYPPNLWLQRIKEAYEDLPAGQPPQGQQQQQGHEVPGAGSNMPLRPSGAKGGQRTPATMDEAIAQGLGYSSLA